MTYLIVLTIVGWTAFLICYSKLQQEKVKTEFTQILYDNERKAHWSTVNQQIKESVELRVKKIWPDEPKSCQPLYAATIGREYGEKCNRLIWRNCTLAPCHGIIKDNREGSCQCPTGHPPCSYCTTDGRYCSICDWTPEQEHNQIQIYLPK